MCLSFIVNQLAKDLKFIDNTERRNIEVKKEKYDSL